MNTISVLEYLTKNIPIAFGGFLVEWIETGSMHQVIFYCPIRDETKQPSLKYQIKREKDRVTLTIHSDGKLIGKSHEMHEVLECLIQDAETKGVMFEHHILPNITYLEEDIQNLVKEHGYRGVIFGITTLLFQKEFKLRTYLKTAKDHIDSSAKDRMEKEAKHYGKLGSMLHTIKIPTSVQ